MRDGIPEAPPSARAVFGDAITQAECYAGLLAGRGVSHGLIGPQEVPRLWQRHLVNCALVAELVPATTAVADLGSGAGLPGIVLAMLRPDCRFTLVEPMLRRCTFLAEAIDRLNLGNVEIRRGRAEELAGTMAADVVTARAVAPLRTLAEWAVGLLRPGGVLLAVKGVRAEQEIREARPVLDRLRVRDTSVIRLGSADTGDGVTVVKITAEG